MHFEQFYNRMLRIIKNNQFSSIEKCRTNHTKFKIIQSSITMYSMHPAICHMQTAQPNACHHFFWIAIIPFFIHYISHRNCFVPLHWIFKEFIGGCRPRLNTDAHTSPMVVRCRFHPEHLWKQRCIHFPTVNNRHMCVIILYIKSAHARV